MSMPAGHLRCRGCDYQGVMQFRPITLRYTMSDGTSVDAGRAFGWCHHCDGVRDIEPKFDLHTARAELGQLRQQSRPAGLIAKLLRRNNEGGAELERAEAWLRLVEQRKSAPRCLACGKPGAVALRFDDRHVAVGFTHSCGQHLYCLPEDPDMPQFFYGTEIIELSEDGRRQ